MSRASTLHRRLVWMAAVACLYVGACKVSRSGTHFDYLVGALKKGDRAQRLEAMDGLVQLGDVRAIKPLLARYRDRAEEGIVREMAIISVAALGDPHLVSHVMEELPAALARNDQEGVRAYMLGKALVEGGARTLPTVIELARRPDPRARDWAIILLGGYRGEQAALSTLLELARSPDPHVRDLAVSSLGQLFMPGAAPAIQAALSDPEPRVRESAKHSWQNVRAVLGGAD